MIREDEIEQIREINRKLPFAAPIAPGPRLADWAESVLGVHLAPWQARLAEMMMCGGQVVWPRRSGRSFARNVVQRYIEDGTSPSIKWLPGSETDPDAPFEKLIS